MIVDSRSVPISFSSGSREKLFLSTDVLEIARFFAAPFGVKSLGGPRWRRWADDAPIYLAEPRNGEVWVMTTFGHADPAGHWSDGLGSGLAHDINLVIAKAVLGLLEASVPQANVVRQVWRCLGAQSREGWGVDLTILTAPRQSPAHAAGGGSPSRPISWGANSGCGLRSSIQPGWSRPFSSAGCGGGQVCATVRPGRRATLLTAIARVKNCPCLRALCL